MEFNMKSDKVPVRYLYDNEDPNTAKPTVLYNIESEQVIGPNNNAHLVGLSNTRNTPIKSSNGLSMFHSEAIEVDGTTMYYWTK